jgi:hypothetical protein
VDGAGAANVNWDAEEGPEGRVRMLTSDPNREAAWR